MDHYRLGQLLGEHHHRISTLEAEWRKLKHYWAKAKHYGKRVSILFGLGLGNYVMHMTPEEIGSKIKLAAGVMVKLLGLAL